MGYVIYAYMWAKMLVAANGDSKLHTNKRILGHFYFNHLLHRANALSHIIRNDMSSVMSLAAEDF
jgi:hypothetical protein